MEQWQCILLAGFFVWACIATALWRRSVNQSKKDKPKAKAYDQIMKNAPR